MEYLRLVKACHDRTSDVDNVSIQLIDEFLNKIENLNIPTSGRMFIKQWGTQILYEKLKAGNRLEEYISKLRTFKLEQTFSSLITRCHDNRDDEHDGDDENDEDENEGDEDDENDDDDDEHDDDDDGNADADDDYVMLV